MSMGECNFLNDFTFIKNLYDFEGSECGCLNL